ncbi:hypothetical protein J3R83DRAFT_1141 [Lanmaoa asiatica]|nr:hypothetical protein J3R83DRAFT_1141 [Lanmaoa asiatica]
MARVADPYNASRTFQSSFKAESATFQEYCLATAKFASKIPDNVSFDQAAPISTCFNPFAVATYAQQPQGIALTPPFETGGLGKYADHPIMIVGGASSLGQYGITAFPPISFYVDAPISTTASLKNKDLLLSLGATHVLDRNLPAAALKEQATSIASTPIVYIFNTVCLEETQQMAYDLLAPDGTLAVVTSNLVKEDETSQKKVFMVYGSFQLAQNHELGVRFATALTKWLAEGKIKPNPVEVLPGGLSGIVYGLKRLETGGVSAKKLVVRPPETPK